MRASFLLISTSSRNKLRLPPSKSPAISNSSLDRYLLNSSSSSRTAAPLSRIPAKPAAPVSVDPPSPVPPKTCSILINFSMGLLSSALESVSQSPDEESKWWCLKELKHRCWLCSNGQEIMAVNFDRLNELIHFDRLINDHILPSRILPSPIEITARSDLVLSYFISFIPFHLKLDCIFHRRVREREREKDANHFSFCTWL